MSLGRIKHLLYEQPTINCKGKNKKLPEYQKPVEEVPPAEVGPPANWNLIFEDTFDVNGDINTTGTPRDARSPRLRIVVKSVYGLRHRGTQVDWLRVYCTDARLLISNIQSEQVAKTIALCRKNFLFCDTPAGASASAMIYSLLETARANDQNVFKYMSVVLNELPAVTSVEQIEALLPWQISADEVAKRFAALPAP